jgi:hypothetical protein
MQTTIVRSGREPPILICKKCLKRSSHGAKIRRQLRRATTVGAHHKAPRLVLTGCFKICPKRAVVLASGTTLAQGEYVLISRPEHAEAALELLKVPKSPDGSR